MHWIKGSLNLLFLRNYAKHSKQASDMSIGPTTHTYVRARWYALAMVGGPWELLGKVRKGFN